MAHVLSYNDTTKNSFNLRYVELFPQLIKSNVPVPVAILFNNF